MDISKEKLQQLRQAEAKLCALEAAGVDSWEGYEFAMEELDERQVEVNDVQDVFYQDQPIKHIFFRDGSQRNASERMKMHIVMVPGQTHSVPWVRTERVDGRVQLFNLALCEGVEIDNAEG